ncbi:hypothetical protein [Pseudodesulfovibrio portus]|uniref:DUF4180 domain-containing protein n=1 Tax=Pseudodesulfovibrio portus TaxID=231439 RepID=A0ABM8AT09_9BACT|nr:hypothetical protein [Pseudodesulfovibrio portus]BDQ34584.1 hypothetical protein JCM14722_21260 [Pseudodesulfovibrio portus]
MRLEVEPKNTYALVRMSGAVPAGTFRNEVSRLMDAVRASGLKRILLDERGLVLGVDTHEAYLVGESEQIVMAAIQGYRFASVPDPANKARNENFETMLRNRSVNYRVFDTIADAEEWLRE